MGGLVLRRTERSRPDLRAEAPADRLINDFEHGTTESRYRSAEALTDGRGITFGRAGFTTKSGDGYDLVKRYTAREAR